MAAKNGITQEELKKLFNYNQDTGLFIRLTGGSGQKNHIGDIAGTISKKGYFCIGIRGKIYKSHRLAWVCIYGNIDPELQVDHINGIKTDNRISNLRLATNTQNQNNLHNPRITNKSGFLGVYFNKLSNKYMASISYNCKRYHLGYFTTAEEAHEAYLKAKRELHPFCTI